MGIAFGSNAILEYYFFFCRQSGTHNVTLLKYNGGAEVFRNSYQIGRNKAQHRMKVNRVSTSPKLDESEMRNTKC